MILLSLVLILSSDHSIGTSIETDASYNGKGDELLYDDGKDCDDDCDDNDSADADDGDSDDNDADDGDAAADDADGHNGNYLI